MQLGVIDATDLLLTASGILLNDLLPATPDSPPQTSSFSTTTSSGVSSGASSSASTAVKSPRSASKKMAPGHTLKDALASNGDMQPKEEPMSREGSETGLDMNGRPPVPLCAICSADSTGIHFGVEACAACSAFFRRTVVLSKNYECTKGGDCVTHKDTAGAARCRACRFKKCINVGMDRGAVQHRRDAIGKVSQIKKESSPGMDDDSMMDSPKHSYDLQMVPSTSQPALAPRSMLDEWINRHTKLSMRRKLFYTHGSLTEAFDDTKNLFPPPTEMRNFSECMFQLWRIEPRLVSEYVNANVHTMHLKPHEKSALFRNFFLSFQAVEEPYLTWQFGGLAKDCWVMPNRMYFHFEHINEYFATSIMSGLNLDMATAVRIFIPSFHHAMDVVARPMSDLGVTYVEMIALSGIIYLDPMAPGISEDTRKYLHKARGELIACLLNFYNDILFKQPNIPDTPEIRLSALINIISGIKIHAERTRENMQILSLFDVIPCDNLFNEMCNIQTAYSDEARSKLRKRAIAENLVPQSQIQASDVKWAEYKRQVGAGILEKGTPINKMQGQKHESFMTAPVLERDSKQQMELQLAMMRSQKKEPEERFVAAGLFQGKPAHPMPAAPAVSAAAHPQLQLQLPLSMASFCAPSPPAAVSLATTAALAASNPSLALASLASQPFTAASLPSGEFDTKGIVDSIILKAEQRTVMENHLENDRARRLIFPNMAADQLINYAGLAQMMEPSTVVVAPPHNQKRKTPQETAGPSVDKRARQSGGVDTGTNPATPPSNSAMMAALAANAAAHQQLQQGNHPMGVVIPYNKLLEQLTMTTNMLQQTPFLINPQHLAAMQAAAAAAAAVQPPVTLAQLQQQQQNQQQHPF
ncbi:hypothetical protein PENTCL1PPCAC_18429 [Pristionchus entomophagus]|uniref:Nhr-66 n=1 Tax=Pristionchus entomophagus TaxID=358040 RepID=A0AAV5TPE4_9BILA|nr:hypothetical protein PENTCL1PPCAC_18429 [Pristionchus entomophagus]